jgi:hypothetical protein
MSDTEERPEEIDYLHPEGKPKVAPRTKAEKEHLKDAKKSEKMVEDLRREQGKDDSPQS